MMGSDEFCSAAIREIVEYVNNSLYKRDLIVITPHDVYNVWYCKTLQNHKALFTTSLRDGVYFECTYNGNIDEMYIDVYKKAENIAIRFGGKA